MKINATLLPKHKLTVARVLRVVCLLVVILGTYKGCTFTVPLQYGDPRGAVGSMMGDDAMANYDIALAYYNAQRYDDASDHIKAAFNALINERGEMAPEDKLRGAQIQFLAGLIYERAKQPRQAVDAYKDALRLDPTHKYAKYNLERLLQPNGGGAGGPGQQPAGGSGKDNKRGI